TRQPTKRSSILDPFRALRHRSLLTIGITALCYNFGFFALLAYTPFPLSMGALEIGLIFCGWGAGVAVTSVFVAPVLQRRFGTVPVLMGVLAAFAVVLAVMGFGTASKP